MFVNLKFVKFQSIRRFLPVVGAMLLATLSSTVAEEGGASAFFPFVKGRYWLYDGTVRFSKDGEAKGKDIKGWKSEVIDTVEGNDFKAALLKGAPMDLAWYEDGRERGDWLFILTAVGGFHQYAPGDMALEIFNTIKTTGKLPKSFDDSRIMFKIPMKVDDRFGDPEQTKLGPRYCWVVSGISKENPKPAVKGISADGNHATYALTYRTSPDHTNIGFTTDLGILSYEYVHHGTPGDCDMRLTETGLK